MRYKKCYGQKFETRNRCHTIELLPLFLFLMGAKCHGKDIASEPSIVTVMLTLSRAQVMTGRSLTHHWTKLGIRDQRTQRALDQFVRDMGTHFDKWKPRTPGVDYLEIFSLNNTSYVITMVP